MADLGPTHHNWHPAVRAQVDLVLAVFRHVTANTYTDHPWPGWDGFSVDFWGPRGRGDALDLPTARKIRRFLMKQPGAPFIRHTILRHSLWTSFGGRQHWPSNDHSGRLLHLHVTYWKL